jgi:hypothetical protein
LPDDHCEKEETDKPRNPSFSKRKTCVIFFEEFVRVKPHYKKDLLRTFY